MKVAGAGQAARQQAQHNLPRRQHRHHGTGLPAQERKTCRTGGQFRLDQQDQPDPDEEHSHEISDDPSKDHRRVLAVSESTAPYTTGRGSRFLLSPHDLPRA